MRLEEERGEEREEESRGASLATVWGSGA